MRRAHALLGREYRHISRLRALLNFLDADGLERYRLVVLDAGPVYTLAWLEARGHPIFDDPRTASWRRYIAALWAVTLDGVVRLDSADDRSVGDRAAIDNALAELRRHGRPEIRDFRTDGIPPHRIAAEIVRVAAASAP
jgi:hypothetical protein